MLTALARNEQAALAAEAGELLRAFEGFRQCLAIDPQSRAARFNFTLLEEAIPDQSFKLPVRGTEPQSCERTHQSVGGKFAIVSFRFNWPTSGGGNIHTCELARFLAKAGYTVRHFYPRFDSWAIGNAVSPPFASEELSFTDKDWNIATIQFRLRQAVDAFRPDCILITDSWNMKPHLAEAMRGYPVFLRFQALECLCPLNNVRLLCDGDGRFSQCRKHQ
jgi:hypothetical protein